MNVKNNWRRTFLTFLLSCTSFIFSMEPAPKPELRPIDKVFLNACKNGRPIKFSIENGANVNVIDPETGFTGLHYICKNGSPEALKLLLDSGANVNEKSNYGTPLYLLFGQKTLDKSINFSQRFEKARLLIERGADVWIDGPDNQSVLYVVVITGNLDDIKLIIKTMDCDKKRNWRTIDNKGYVALAEAIIENKNDMLLELLDAGVPMEPRERTKDGLSLIHYAASYRNKKAIQELVKRGLDIDILDDDKQSALHLVSMSKHADIASILLDLGADPNIRDKNGKTPVDLSQDNPNKEVRKILLRAQKEKSLSKKSARKARKELLVSKKTAPVAEVVVPEEKTEILPTQSLDTEKLPEREKLSEKPILISPRKIEKVPEKVANKSKPSSFASYVQEKATQTHDKVVGKVRGLMPQNVQPATLARTYANIVGNQGVAQEPEEKIATLIDDYMTISVVVPPHMVNTLSLMGQQDNPLVGIKNYSKHVEEKRNKSDDMFHNFSPRVEERFGFIAQSTIIKGATKKHSATIKYVIPAYVKIFSENPIYGEFEFVVRDGIMEHRFFKPDQKKSQKGKKVSLSLPALS